jgi:hypothetical protein
MAISTTSASRTRTTHHVHASRRVDDRSIDCVVGQVQIVSNERATRTNVHASRRGKDVHRGRVANSRSNNANGSERSTVVPVRSKSERKRAGLRQRTDIDRQRARVVDVITSTGGEPDASGTGREEHESDVAQADIASQVEEWRSDHSVRDVEVAVGANRAAIGYLNSDRRSRVALILGNARGGACDRNRAELSDNALCAGDLQRERERERLSVDGENASSIERAIGDSDTNVA